MCYYLSWGLQNVLDVSALMGELKVAVLLLELDGLAEEVGSCRQFPIELSN